MLDVPGEEIVWIDGDKINYIEQPHNWIVDFGIGLLLGGVVTWFIIG